MCNDRVNAEGYPDPTCYAALSKVMREAKLAFRPLVYICSPYRGDEVNNAMKAQYYCRFAVEEGRLPIAPHIYFPQFLSDEKADERELAMFMNFILLGKCHELWCFGNAISEGMQQELDRAKKYGKAIRYFTDDLEEVER